jgi:hypothetical protein
MTEDGSCGCALGGALLAAGVSVDTFRRQFGVQSSASYMRRFLEIECVQRFWPWLREQHIIRISNLYCRVASGYATIEDVAAYAREIETPHPLEPQPEPQHAEEVSETCLTALRFA